MAEIADVGIWINAICASLVGDDRELIELLRYDNELDRYPDVKEFLAWRLARSSGRPDADPPGRPDADPLGKPDADPSRKKKPPLPAKFWHLRLMAKDEALFDAFVKFEMTRGRWYSKHPGGRFPYKKKIEELGAMGGKVDAVVRGSKNR